MVRFIYLVDSCNKQVHGHDDVDNDDSQFMASLYAEYRSDAWSDRSGERARSDNTHVLHN